MLNLKPGVFDPEDQAKAAEHQANVRTVIGWGGLAFCGASATRFWQIKTGNTRVSYGVAGIFVSYAPALYVYNNHQSAYNAFIRDVSERYKDRISDESLKSF